MPNTGHFKKGFDPRRHLLTRAERQKGYEVATRQSRQSSRVRAWLWRKIKRYYQTGTPTGSTVYDEFASLED
jgi:hypothetical protein